MPERAVQTLVLLPGMDGTGDLFSRLAAALPSALEVRIVRYPVSQPQSYAQLCAWVEAALPTDRPYGLLGESFSGPVAITVASRSPPGLAKLILCCTFDRSPRPAPRFLRSAISWLPLSAMPLGLLGRALMGRQFSDGVQAELATAMRRLSPETLRTRLRSVLDVDVSGLVPRIRVPILYLRATEDWVVPKAASQRLLTMNPAIEAVDLAGPHFLLQIKAVEAAREIVRFLASRA
jgi:pimeloyl-ACP methyl ester carboxylesterase